jgi:glycosyltransferase involved in cell wall biosynthesis
VTISIITVSYNSVKTIERTILSVIGQDFTNLEYILVDGGSTDGTVDVIRKYAGIFSSKISYISEPDSGIYDAMNKGISLSTSDVIGFLNSDDYYASSDSLSIVCQVMQNALCDSCYGNLMYVKNHKPYRYWRSNHRKSFRMGWMPPHPAFFVKKHVYEAFGGFRLDCGTSADYEIMLRFLYINKITTIWIDKILIFMEAGGASNNGIKSRYLANIADAKAWNVNFIRPSLLTSVLKKTRKIPQFVSAFFYMKNI